MDSWKWFEQDLSWRFQMTQSLFNIVVFPQCFSSQCLIPDGSPKIYIIFFFNLTDYSRFLHDNKNERVQPLLCELTSCGMRIFFFYLTCNYLIQCVQYTFLAFCHNPCNIAWKQDLGEKKKTGKNGTEQGSQNVTIHHHQEGGLDTH